MRQQKWVRRTWELLKKEIPSPQNKCSREECDTKNPNLSLHPIWRQGIFPRSLLGGFPYTIQVLQWSRSPMQCQYMRKTPLDFSLYWLVYRCPLSKLTWGPGHLFTCATENTRESWLRLETRGQGPTSRAHVAVIALQGLSITSWGASRPTPASSNVLAPSSLSSKSSSF